MIWSSLFLTILLKSSWNTKVSVVNAFIRRNARHFCWTHGKEKFRAWWVWQFKKQSQIFPITLVAFMGVQIQGVYQMDHIPAWNYPVMFVLTDNGPWRREYPDRKGIFLNKCRLRWAPFLLHSARFTLSPLWKKMITLDMIHAGSNYMFLQFKVESHESSVGFNLYANLFIFTLKSKFPAGILNHTLYAVHEDRNNTPIRDVFCCRFLQGL